MANTYKALQTVTVGAGGAANITFSNIPQTYTDLSIVVSARYSNTGSQNTLWISAINGNASGFTNSWLRGSGSAAISTTDATGGIYVGAVNGSSSTANTFANISIYIPNYAGNTFKSISIDAVQENNQTEAYMGFTAGLWSNSAPITEITIDPDGANNFAQYTTATLYGVFNADVSSAPAVPTIGTATATGITTATVAFTGVSNAASYTATSTPGSITATGTTSPLSVTGLTGGTSYTFKVKSNNPFGSSAESAASNSITTLVGAYESIATTSVGAGGVSSITFSSIPSTFTHLQIRYIARYTDGNNDTVAFSMRLNGDTGANYTEEILAGYGGGQFSAGGGANKTSIGQLYGIGGGALASAFGAGIIDILDYKNTSKLKTVRAEHGTSTNANTSINYSAVTTGIWRSTTAINSITFNAPATNFAQNSHFALYGIKSA